MSTRSINVKGGLLADMQAMAVSVVIPAYNNAGGVVRLLTSCERLRYPPEKLEFIVVDDGSDDGTAELVENMDFHFDLHVLRLPENRGRSAARNAGLHESRFEIVLFIDSDMEVDPDLILYHVESYDDRTVGVMGDFILPPFVKKNRWFKYLDSDKRGARAWSKAHKTREDLPFQYIMTANLSVFREKAQLIGGFDEDMRHYGGEDMEFAYRMRLADQGVIKFQPLAVTFHQHRSFRDTLLLLREYGREVLPYLEIKHPDIRLKLASRFIRAKERDKGGFAQKVAQTGTAIALRSPFVFLARGIRLISPSFIAFPMIKYIMLYNVLSGYRQQMKPGKS